MEKRFENKNVILASQSPRRHSLIKKIVSNFDVVAPEFDEKLDSDNYTDDVIKSLSLQKALSALNTHKQSGAGICLSKGCLIISADTMVVFNNKIYGKPKDELDAQKMLSDLSGNTHFVVTAITVLDSDSQEYVSDVVKTYVTFQNLSEDLIKDYVKNKKPLDKAGAYGIQEMGSEFIKNVDGDLENVIGFPTQKVRALLEQMGYKF